MSITFLSDDTKVADRRTLAIVILGIVLVFTGARMNDNDSTSIVGRVASIIGIIAFYSAVKRTAE